MTGEPTHGRTLVERLIAALWLKPEVYQQVSVDRTANSQAFTVVVLAGISNGLGLVQRLGGPGVSAGVAAALIGWFLWAAVILAIAGSLARRRGGHSLLRALAFADAPGVLLILGIVPVIGSIARVLIVVWLVAATAVAVEAVFEASRRRAVVISVIALVAYLFLGVVSAYFVAP